MIVLNGTAIILRLVTSAAVAVDANIGFFDSNMSVFPPTFATNAQRTKISTATTTTIGSAPGSGVTREIKYVGICATGGACIVRPEVFDGSSAFQCVGDATGVSLAVGETLEYIDTTGWSVKDINGAVKYTLGPTLNGHIVKDNSTARTQRGSLNMVTTPTILFTAVDDSINNETELSGRLQGFGTDNAGGAAITLGDGNAFNLITSTTTITSFAFTNDFAGRRAFLIFLTSRTLTHNATSLILPGLSNIVTQAGDVCEIVSLGSGNFRVIDYVKANYPPGGALVTQTTAQTQTATTTNLTAGSFSIPVGLEVGSEYLWEAMYYAGRGVTLGATNLIIELLVNGAAVRTVTLAIINTASQNRGGKCWGRITIRSLGAGGTMMCSLESHDDVVAAAGGVVALTTDPARSATSPATTAIDTTVARTTELRMRLSAATATVYVHMLHCTLNKVR